MTDCFTYRSRPIIDGCADRILQVYLNMSSNKTGEVVKLPMLITVITTPLMMICTW